MTNKVIFFIAALSSGGAEHQLTVIASLLAKHGYNVTITTYSDVEDHYSFDDHINRVRLARGKSVICKLFAIWKYFLLLRTDCVISFTARDNFLALPPLFFRPKIKIIVSERCAFFSTIPFYERINYALLYRIPDYIVPNSITQKNEIIRKWPKYTSKTVAITNYTDVNLYKFSPMPHNAIVKIAIFGRYSEQKNYHRFAEALKLLKDKTKVRFKILWFGNKHIGEKTNPHFENFQSLIDTLGIKDYIELNDHIDNVPDVLPHFDALCLPSIGEGFSNSISEYICVGRPVLASNVADNSYLVHDGENGFLFDPYDVNEIAEAFLKFLSLSEEIKDEMGKASRRIAESLFDKNRFVNAYIELLK